MFKCTAEFNPLLLLPGSLPLLFLLVFLLLVV